MNIKYIILNFYEFESKLLFNKLDNSTLVEIENELKFEVNNKFERTQEIGKANLIIAVSKTYLNMAGAPNQYDEDASSSYIEYCKRQFEINVPVIIIGIEKFEHTENVYYSQNIFLTVLKNIEAQCIIEKNKIHPFYKFWDSSIWLRYVYKDAQFDTNFKKVLKEFEKNFDNELYKLVVTNEFLDFQKRLLSNSYIEDRGESGHSKKVFPFIFHSETFLQNEAEKESLQLWGIKWRILLIDDFSNKKLKTISKKKGKITPINSHITKSKIIEEILIKFGIEFEIESRVSNLKEIAKELTHNQDINKFYDIILLDYLLTDENENIEYGDDLINFIKTSNNVLKSPVKTFWIMPVSAYGDALLKDLRSNAIPLYDENWVISAGADPVCTPHLFSYKLLSFMRRQLIGIVDTNGNNNNNNENINDNNNNKSPTSKLLSLLKDITKDDKKIVQSANTYFADFVELGSTFKRLMKFNKEVKDATGIMVQQSPFAKSVIEKYFFNMDITVWKTLEYLIYLLTYGNYLQQNEMWRAWIRLDQWKNNNLIKLNEIDNENKIFEEFDLILKNIKMYIENINT